MRAKKYGWKIVCDTSIFVIHKRSKKSSLYLYYMTRNKIILARLFNKYIIKTVLIEFKKIISNLIYLKFTKVNLIILKAIVSGLLTPINNDKNINNI
jgi:GT2 family glycosyltransferase